MDVTTALRAMRRAWYLVLAGAVGAVVVSFAPPVLAAPFHETSSTSVVPPAHPPPAPAAGHASLRTLDDARSRAIVATFAEVLTSSGIQEAAAENVGIEGLSASDYSFSAVILPEANVVELTVRGPRPQAAVLLSGAVGDLAAARFTELYQIYDIVLLDAPPTPSDPANTPLLQQLVMAAALGLLAGSALALLWGAPQVRRIQQRERRLLSYSVSEESSVVTPLRNREDQQAAGSG